jgi:hypothetical protein
MPPQPGSDGSREARVAFLRARADELLRDAIAAGDAGLWGDVIRHAAIDTALDLFDQAQHLQGPSPVDSIEILLAKLAATEQLLGQAQRDRDRLSKARDELRLAITVKQGTCLCAAQRHVSCSKQRPWCTVNDCLCDTCRLRESDGQRVRL